MQFIKKKHFSLIALFLGFCFSFSIKTNAQTIKVCFKTPTVASGSYAIGGTFRTFADEKLLNTANFGPSGTSPYTFDLFNFISTPITEALLVSNGCHIFDAGLNTTDAGGGTTFYSATEQAELTSWGSSTENIIIGFQSYAEVFSGSAGYSIVNSNVNPVTLTNIGEAAFAGPFGGVTSFNEGGTYQGIYDMNPQDDCVLVIDAAGNPSAVLDNSANNIYLADVDIISENAGLTNNDGVSTNADIIFANMYHSLAKSIVNNTTNNPCEYYAELNPGPAGVNGQTMWVKADENVNSMTDGSPISNWGYVGSVTELTQSNAGLQPLYDENWQNFNPGINFTSDYLFNATNTPWGNTSNGYSTFVIYQGTGAGTNTNYFGNHDDGTAFGSNDAVIYTSLANASEVYMTHPITSSVVTHTGINNTDVFLQESSYAGAGMTGSGTNNGSLSSGGTGVQYNSTGAAVGGTRGANNNGTINSFRTTNTTFGELIVYPEELSALDKSKVRTYLALKYGTTLQTPSDYIAPDGTVLWDVGATGGFDNDIAGIGNDGYCLKQKQSTSANGDIVTMSKGPLADLNKNNLSTIKKDNYKLWGNDGGSTSTFTTNGVNMVEIMERKWLISESGETGLVTIIIPSADLPAGGDTPYFIVSDDPTFDETDSYYEMTLNGSNYEIEINCENADYFTFGYGPEIEVTLTLDKTTSATSAGSGDNVTITTTITNTGATTATDVKINDAVPLGMTLNTATPSIGSYNPTSGVWTIPSLPPGTATLTFDLTVQ